MKGPQHQGQQTLVEAKRGCYTKPNCRLASCAYEHRMVEICEEGATRPSDNTYEYAGGTM